MSLGADTTRLTRKAIIIIIDLCIFAGVDNGAYLHIVNRWRGQRRLSIIMMIKSGMRLYSLQEIQKMVESNSYTAEFLEYLNCAPENIKQLLKWSGGSPTPLTVDSTPANEPKHGAEQNISGHENSSVYVTGEDKHKYDNVYKDLIFDKRLRVRQLILHELVQSHCDKHKMPYKKVQVLIQLNNGAYSLVTPCCPECKMLYMDSERFKTLEHIFKEKEIDYKWIQA